MKLPYPIDEIRRHPGMYFREPSFDVVSAFVEGYDAATIGGFLIGFREWLIVKLNDGNNLSWSQLALRLLQAKNGHQDPSSQAIGLLDLLEEFLVIRHSCDGLRKIYIHYEEWLGGQNWYTPASPQWVRKGDK